MSRNENDPISHVPKMAPSHDEIASFQRSKGRGTLASSLGDIPDVDGGGGSSSMGVKSVLTVVVMLLLAVSGFAGYLYQTLQKAQGALNKYEIRIGELERRLSVTDESMSESTVAMKVKAQEMDSEIRKLWDNVWKKSKERFGKLDKQLSVLQQGVQRSDVFIETAKQQWTENNKVISELSVKLGHVEKMETQIVTNQQKLSQQEGHLESASDKVNRLGSDVSKIDRRVKSTEQWVESINGFRRQVNRDMSTLKQSVGQLEGGAASPKTTP